MRYIISFDGGNLKWKGQTLMKLDGTDIKFLLEKKGYNLSDVARDMAITPQGVQRIIWGLAQSRRVTAYIETLLGLRPESLIISRSRTKNALKAA